MTEEDIKTFIRKDQWMMQVLRSVRELDLPDWWIGAGFVRNKIWDVLHGYKQRTPLNDVDVIYFDPENTDESQEKAYEKQLTKLMPDVPWSVKNQKRMESLKHDGPYVSSVDGLSRWTGTATCIGVHLANSGKLLLTAPHGIEDLVNLIVRPTPNQQKYRPDGFEKRLKEKNWLAKWPRLTILHTA